MSIGRPEFKFLDIMLLLVMIIISSHTLYWTSWKEPLVRHLRPGNGPKTIIFDALDLMTSLRGYGWDWSRTLRVPKETRPANRVAFAFYTSLSAFQHTFICGALHRTILTLAPVGHGLIPNGSTIFDDTLPFLLRFLRSSIIAFLTFRTIQCAMQVGCDLCTLFGVLFLGQDSAQWPPLFDAPFSATSVADLWGRRWQQCLRRTFLVTGGTPLSFLGRTGITLGSFLSSGFIHYLTLVKLDGRAELWRMFVGFGMMAVGIYIEWIFEWWTNKNVGGLIGNIWATVWVVLWGNVIVEGFARAGAFGCAGFIDSVLPARIPVEYWVAKFDAWLHTVAQGAATG